MLKNTKFLGLGFFFGIFGLNLCTGNAELSRNQGKNGIFRRFQEFCSWNTAEEATKWLDLMIFEAFFNLNDSNQ